MPHSRRERAWCSFGTTSRTDLKASVSGLLGTIASRTAVRMPAVKRVGILTIMLLLALGATAQGQVEKLSKADARVAANLAGYDFTSHRSYLTSMQIGACRRLAATRFHCEGQASGDEFKGCEQTAPFECHSTFHRCEFKVEVHKAGYSALGRVSGVHCKARRHST
jgi:hypothetical protein